MNELGKSVPLKNIKYSDVATVSGLFIDGSSKNNLLLECKNATDYFFATIGSYIVAGNTKFFGSMIVSEAIFKQFKKEHYASEHLRKEIKKHILVSNTNICMFNTQISGVTTNGMLQTWNRFVKNSFEDQKDLIDAQTQTGKQEQLHVDDSTQPHSSNKERSLIKFN
jgi:hypothetical protein